MKTIGKRWQIETDWDEGPAYVAIHVAGFGPVFLGVDDALAFAGDIIRTVLWPETVEDQEDGGGAP